MALVSAGEPHGPRSANANPASIFPDHMFISHNGTYYDPSYGLT